MNVPDEIKIDYNRAVEYGIGWVKEYFAKAGKTRAVIGLSGGSDSTLTAYICAMALGGQNVLGLIMPTKDSSPADDVSDAEGLAGILGIKTIRTDITAMLDAVCSGDKEITEKENRVAYANLKARLRMVLLYKEANKISGLVAGTDDRSEHELGYFTKYGDGGVDINVPEYLYKTQVRALLMHIADKTGEDVYRRVAEKLPSPQLWKGQTAEDEMSMKYEDIDRILYYMNDYGKKTTREDIAAATGLGTDTIDRVLGMKNGNMHKNILPPSPGVIDLK